MLQRTHISNQPNAFSRPTLWAGAVTRSPIPYAVHLVNSPQW